MQKIPKIILIYFVYVCIDCDRAHLSVSVSASSLSTCLESEKLLWHTAVLTFFVRAVARSSTKFLPKNAYHCWFECISSEVSFIYIFLWYLFSSPFPAASPAERKRLGEQQVTKIASTSVSPLLRVGCKWIRWTTFWQTWNCFERNNSSMKRNFFFNYYLFARTKWFQKF